MKLINKYTLIALLFTMLINSGCDDFIDLYPSNSISDADIYSSIDIAGSALVGLYNDVQAGGFLGRNIQYRGAIKGPDFMLLTGSGQYFGPEYRYDENVSSYGEAGDIWENAFEMIKDCNTFLYGVQDLAESTEKADMVAQAKALKGIAYFELTKQFCYPPSFAEIDEGYQLGLPIIKSKDDYANVLLNGMERSSLSETFTYAEELLSEALADIDQDRTDVIYITKYAIYAYLAEINLYLENWQEVIDYGTAAAANASMIGKDEYLTAIRTDCNAESIFEIENTVTDDLGRNMLGYVLVRSLDENGRYNAEVSEGYGDSGASDGFISLLQENPTDIRLELLGEDKMSNTTATDPLVHGVNGYTTRYYYKYLPYEGTTTHNTPLMKVPEVFLMISEAYSELGSNDALALSYLNKVFEERTGETLAGLTGDNLKDAIFNERRRELALEGVAIWDYLRKMRSFTRDDSHNTVLTIDPTTEAGRESDDFHKVVCPIPLTELNVNPLIQQNPGYSSSRD